MILCLRRCVSIAATSYFLCHGHDDFAIRIASLAYTLCEFSQIGRMSSSAKEGSPVHAVITKIDRMKTRQGESLFLKVDVGGETVRVFGRPEELAERLEASGYDIPASEIEAGMELHLPCLP